MTFLASFFIVFTIFCMINVATTNINQDSVLEELYEIFMAIIALTVVLLIWGVPIFIVYAILSKVV